MDRLATKTKASMVRLSDGVSRLDKKSSAALLEAAGYALQKERDLDLYVKGDPLVVVVLDNELGLYQTSVDDVAMRKSPTVKEMVSIKNAVKILKDSDVKKSIKDDTVDTVHVQAVSMLDLAYTDADLSRIAQDGIDSLENGYEKGVICSLELFAELLGYTQAPKSLRIADTEMYGGQEPGRTSELKLSPVILFDRIHNRLYLQNGPVSSFDKASLEKLKGLLSQTSKPDKEGAAVFKDLKSRVPPYPGNLPV